AHSRPKGAPHEDQPQVEQRVNRRKGQDLRELAGSKDAHGTKARVDAPDGQRAEEGRRQDQGVGPDSEQPARKRGQEGREPKVRSGRGAPGPGGPRRRPARLGTFGGPPTVRWATASGFSGRVVPDRDQGPNR